MSHGDQGSNVGRAEWLDSFADKIRAALHKFGYEEQEGDEGEEDVVRSLVALVQKLSPELPKADNRNGTGFEILPDGTLSGRTYQYTWCPRDRKEATLDGDFTAEDLRAIAAWMEARPK